MQRLVGIKPHHLLKKIIDHKYFSLFDDDQELYIYQNQLTVDQFKLFAQFIKENNSIKKIIFRESSIDDEGLQIFASALIENHHITELLIDSPKKLTQNVGIAAIINLLCKNTSLTSLHLNGCGFGSQDAIDLSQALAENQNLSKLSIGVDPIGSTAATAILEAANIQQSLSSLKFWNTNLDDNLERFGKALADNQSLTELILYNNIKIGNQGAICLANQLKKNKTLKRLLLQGTAIKLHSHGHTILQKVFKKNYWMDEMILNNLELRRTSQEREFQIEREVPLLNTAGKNLTLISLKKMLADLTIVEPKIKSYLNNFEDESEEYQLTYADTFKLMTTINSSISIDKIKDKLFNHTLIKEVFSGPYFFKLFFRLYHLSLINENNFKTYYLFSNNERIVLHQLFNDVHHDLTVPISESQKKSLESLLTHSNPLLFSLFTTLIENILFSKNDLLLLVSLSLSNIERLHEIVNKLFNAKMLTHDSYQTAFDRIAAKKPKFLASVATKIGKNNNPNTVVHSQIILNGAISIFIESKTDKNYFSGSFGKIKKGFDSDQNIDTPVYSIKKFHRNDDNEDVEKYATRSMQANNLLGRDNAYFFKRKKFYYIVSIWQSGNSLDEFENDELTNEPFINRLRCIISGLSEIERLHAFYYIHGDIKSANFIVNLKTYSMKLIDLDGVRKKGSHRGYGPHTHFYMDYNRFKENKQSFPDDVFAMGWTISEFFPELYNGKFFIKDINDMSSVEIAIVSLISVMTLRNREKRCTITAALDYCRQIEVNIHNLDNDTIINIAHHTILQNQVSVEDIIRGKTAFKKNIS